MIIKNASTYNALGQWFPAELSTAGSLIQSLTFTPSDSSGSDGEVLDAEGGFLVPGLIDLHFHGCNGSDFCDGTPEALETIAAHELSQGITTIAPASMSLPIETLEKIFKNAAEFSRQQNGRNLASLAGINMEGPYLAPAKKGAHDEQFLSAPKVSQFKRLQKLSGGLIRLVTVAPELSGAEDFISSLKDDVRISLGHTAANYQLSSKAFQDGARHVTHLFNAMPPFAHRETGLIGAAYDSYGVTTELICDGVHVSPPAVRAAFSMFGPSRLVLISDSMRAAGLRDGRWKLGSLDVNVKGNVASLDDGTIAGSVTNLFICVQKAIEFGIPAADAFRCASENPAKCLGIYDRCGSLDAGKSADILILDKAYSLKHVIHQGVLVF